MSPENKSERSAKPIRAPRVDGKRNRTALIAAARELFARSGPDVAMDEIARSAGVANATLYRHFRTRAELIIAVYAGEVAELEDLAHRLRDARDAEQALARWLEAFVRHVRDKRSLALALPDEPTDTRGALFANWHNTMSAAAEELLARAQARGTARSDVTASDLLALAAGIALTGLDEDRVPFLLNLVRHGYVT
jgi:AcrR family transcriptional regulator